MSLPFTPEQEAAFAAYARAAQQYTTWEGNDAFQAASEAAAVSMLGEDDGDAETCMEFDMCRYAATLLDRLAAAERDIATLLEIVGDHVNPKHLTSEDAETLNRIRQRTQEKRT